MHSHLHLNLCLLGFDYFHKSAIHQASMASVLAADDNGCHDLALLSQRVGHVGAALDNIKQGCLT